MTSVPHFVYQGTVLQRSCLWLLVSTAFWWSCHQTGFTGQWHSSVGYPAVCIGGTWLFCPPSSGQTTIFLPGCHSKHFTHLSAWNCWGFACSVYISRYQSFSLDVCDVSPSSRPPVLPRILWCTNSGHLVEVSGISLFLKFEFPWTLMISLVFGLLIS